MSNYDTELHDLCSALFHRFGNLAVIDIINDYRPSTEWEFCEACDGEFPAQAHVCLCCGSPTTTKEVVA